LERAEDFTGVRTLLDRDAALLRSLETWDAAIVRAFEQLADTGVQSAYRTRASESGETPPPDPVFTTWARKLTPKAGLLVASPWKTPEAPAPRSPSLAARRRAADARVADGTAKPPRRWKPLLFGVGIVGAVIGVSMFGADTVAVPLVAATGPVTLLGGLL